MKKYLRLLCVSVLISVVVVVVSLSPSQAAGDLTEDAVRWLHTGESFQVEGYFFEDERIGAECSQNCYDLDLALYDPQSGKRVAVDDDGSVAPDVRVPYEGAFVLEVGMQNCAGAGGCRTWVLWEE